MEKISNWETGEYRMNFNLPKQWAFWLKLAVPIVLVLAVGSTSFYMVDTDEEGVVQRFGKYVRTTGPGAPF
jgi:regulator of protease activity HflC (stomatin/prohibitin superfamily)